jgi:prepilin-type processing-associated H-X9-DG protein
VAVTGSHTLWSNTTTNRLANIHDGPENTILLIELANSDIQWAEPTDLTFEHICEEIDSDPELKIFAAHDIDRGFFFLPDKGTHVLFADGHIQFMSTGFLRKNLKAMLTCDGGEKIDFSEIPAPKLDWPRIVALLILGAVVVSLMRRPKKVGESGAIDIQSSITPTKESSL